MNMVGAEHLEMSRQMSRVLSLHRDERLQDANGLYADLYAAHFARHETHAPAAGTGQGRASAVREGR